MKKAITLVEIMVASILLAAVLAGLLASFVSVRKYVSRANTRLDAANLAGGSLAALSVDVRADQWNCTTTTYNLSDGNSNQITVPLDNSNYVSNYTVSGVTGHDFRQVVMNVSY
jgi:type II secretory pathway pseudopilin PulG